MHVPHGLHHDGIPARDLGLHFLWINRHGETNARAATPPAEFVNLDVLAA